MRHDAEESGTEHNPREVAGIVPPAATPWCGPPTLTPSALFRRDPSGGIPALFHGRRVAYSFNTRVAIRQACDILGLTPGDGILVPAWNCGSEVDPLLDAGLKVTLYPVDRQGEIDPEAVARLVGPGTRAIYVTHYFGFPQPATAALRQLCDERGLWLIEDCALSLLSGPDPAAGRTGDVAVFCLYKFFPTLAGGALVLNSDRIKTEGRFDAPPPWSHVIRPAIRAALDMAIGAKRIADLRKRMKRPGVMIEADAPPQPDMPAAYYFDPDLRDTRISGLARRALPSFYIAGAIAARRANWQHYLDLLGPKAGVTPLFATLPDDVCPQSMPVLAEGRDGLARALQAKGIAASAWWSGYNKNLDWNGVPDAHYLKHHVLSLPLHQGMDKAGVAHVVQKLEEICAGRRT